MGRVERFFGQVRHNIATHGVHIQWVAAGEGEPCFAYTVGLAGKDHPELIVFTLGPNESQYVLNNFAFRVRDGVQTFEGPQIVLGLNEDVPAMLLPVADSSKHLTVSNEMYRVPGQGPIAALQVVAPDTDGRWPWEAHSTLTGMPLLGDIPEQPISSVALNPHQP